MAPEKTEALLVTDRRSFQYPRIILGEHEIDWKKSIKYLGVQLDRRLSFGEHLQIATAKAIQCGAARTLLMPNIGGPRETKRSLVASVINSKLRYAAPTWTSALNNHTLCLCRNFRYVEISKIHIKNSPPLSISPNTIRRRIEKK